MDAGVLREKFLHLIGSYSDDQDYNIKCWNEIDKRYSSPSRHYHNLAHLSDMIRELGHVSTEVDKPDRLLFAIYYHDIIYKPYKSDNEYQSALLFKKRISQTDFTGIEEGMAQIMATKEHKLSADKDTNILIDLDLSVLGKKPEEYTLYRQNIRKEYKMYPGPIYRKGRIKILENFLASDTIYKTAFFQNKYEKQARENLKSELLLFN